MVDDDEASAGTANAIMERKRKFFINYLLKRIPVHYGIATKYWNKSGVLLMTEMSGVAKECFQVLLRYNYNVKLFDEDGMTVVEPTEARRMFAASPNLMVSLSDADDDSSIKLLFGKSTHANDIDGLMQALRTTATKYNFTFEPRQYGREIDAKDYQNLMSVSESLRKNDMHLCEGLYGTSRSSYLQLDNAKMIVHHSGRIDISCADGRAQHIESIYVENSSGSRYQLPNINLAAGRALTEHVSKGGHWTDTTAQTILDSFVPPEIPVTRLTLAEKNPVVQDFIIWTEKFAPDRALMEYNDPYSPAEDGRYDNAADSTITDFDSEDFANSDDARTILSGSPEDDDRDVSKRDLTSALSEYLRQHIELHDPNFNDSGFQDDTALKSIVDAVYDRAAEAVQNAGYIIVDDTSSNDALDEFGEIGGDDDHTLTREDILLPNGDQGSSLHHAVTKAVVHDDPVNPDEEHPPGTSYIQRLKTLAGVNSGRPVP